MDPAVGLLRSLPIIQPGKAPGMLQGVPIVEDFTAPHKHLAPVPDPLGSIPHNHYHGGAVSNQPNSRNCAYRRAKMASASPRQLPRKRRTTMLQGVLIVEDFTAPHKHLAPVPDPLGSIPHNHYHGVSRVQPAQLAQLRIQARELGWLDT